MTLNILINHKRMLLWLNSNWYAVIWNVHFSPMYTYKIQFILHIPGPEKLLHKFPCILRLDRMYMPRLSQRFMEFSMNPAMKLLRVAFIHFCNLNRRLRIKSIICISNFTKCYHDIHITSQKRRKNSKYKHIERSDNKYIDNTQKAWSLFEYQKKTFFKICKFS